MFRGVGPNTPSSDSKKEWPKFKSPSGVPKHMQKEKDIRYKSNSTSSLYIKDTIASPDINELVKSMSIAFVYHMETGLTVEKVVTRDVFDERKHPLSKAQSDVSKIPDIQSVYQFLITIFNTEQLGAQCGILCLAYVERIMEVCGLTLTPFNWKRVVLSALILASKVWEDQAVWNVDFLSVFPCLTVKDLGELEKNILNMLQFNVSLKSSLYAKYYFELKSLAEQEARNFPLLPLTVADAEKLEKRSSDIEQEQNKEQEAPPRFQRRNSANSLLPTKSPRVVLN